MNRKAVIAENLATVRGAIERAEEAAGRRPGSVQLLPVTKFHPASDVEILRDLGVTMVAENREQEARAKAAEVPGVEFQMIGQIQTKKANAVARWAAGVHSLDSVDLARKLDRGVALALERGDRTRTELPCFLQLSYDGDTSRGGAPRDDIMDILQAVEDSAHLTCAGVMCVPPLAEDPARVFSAVRELTDEVGRQLGRPVRMSAGMTADMAAAIAAGTDIVRVGTAIMGQRPVA